MCNYKHTLQIYKLLNQELPKSGWVDLNFQKVFHSRTETFNFVKTNNYRAGLNLLCNRFHASNNKIEYNWMLENFESYKIGCKIFSCKHQQVVDGMKTS